MAKRKTFGRVLRELRRTTGMGIKSLAPELGVSYSYVSKIENDVTAPSETFVNKTADYFETDPSVLLIAAGKVPPDIMRILQTYPDQAIAILREHFGRDK